MNDRTLRIATRLADLALAYGVEGAIGVADMSDDTLRIVFTTDDGDTIDIGRTEYEAGHRIEKLAEDRRFSAYARRLAETNPN